ncbi:MAG: hypothetical protein H8D56_26870 [Planctomycetes bacterium]|nr:hypothetical protein [Planctomycetota bacterium]
MTHSELQYKEAARALEKIFFLISPEYIEDKITAPLDFIVTQFCEREDIEYSHRNFHKTIAEFIQTVSEKTALYGCKLTLEKAHSEAVFLMNHFYRGFHDEGMDGVMNDAFNPDYEPMALVLSNLNMSLKGYMQKKHFDRIKYRYIDSAGWQMRQIMTKILFARFDIPLEEPMDKWSIEQLSGRLFGLIQEAARI